MDTVIIGRQTTVSKSKALASRQVGRCKAKVGLEFRKAERPTIVHTGVKNEGFAPSSGCCLLLRVAAALLYPKSFYSRVVLYRE